MFPVILHSQWKWARTILLLVVVAAFTLPLVAVRSSMGSLYEPQYFIARLQGWAIGFTLLAATAGLILGMSAWGADHMGRHVYALSLPVERWRYVLLRFGAGALLLLAPVLALLVGALLASRSIDLPAGLHAYPVALTLRFALASLVAFALVFAISAGTPRTAGLVLGALLLVVVVEWGAEQLGAEPRLVEHLVQALFVKPGLLAVFGGRWMLIDV